MLQLTDFVSVADANQSFHYAPAEENNVKTKFAELDLSQFPV